MRERRRAAAALGGLAATLTLAFSGAPAMAACRISSVELPLTMVGMKAMVPAKINGTEVRFALDSGAFYSTISPGAAAELQLPSRALPFGYRMSGVGGDAEIHAGVVKLFTLANTPLHDVEFIVGGSEVARGSVGLLGQNVLRLFDVDYDLARGAVRLLAPRDCGGRDLGYWAPGAAQIIPIEPNDGGDPHTIGVVKVNGARIHATFDTGAGNTVLSLRAAARAGIRPDTPGVRPAGYSTGVGSRLAPTWIAPVASFEIGGEKITNTRLLISELGPETDMLLGADFFLSHRVLVANSQRKLYFTYNGGPVFRLERSPARAAGQADAGQSAPGQTAQSQAAQNQAVPGQAVAAPEVSADQPKDADGYSRRGAASAARRDFLHAFPDFDRAVALAPNEPRYLYERAQAHIAARQPALALADLDAALKLRPDDPDARMARATLRLERQDREGARADLDAASAAASHQSDLRLRMGELYAQLDGFEPATAQFDAWIAVHPADARRAEALNGRCWARALWGRDLDKALSDCNGALRLMPRDPAYLDSRGLVRLRRGEYDRAIADYDAALAIAPKLVMSLYGRGVAELKSGKTAAGQADVAAATVASPQAVVRAKRLGIE